MRKYSYKIGLFLLLTVALLVCAGLLGKRLWQQYRRPVKPTSAAAAAEGGASCSKKHKCGAIDPVSDPKYNMKEIAKQSILLEEHLVERKKRCKDCIAKHFLHIIGLAEEGQCLAGSKTKTYPHMDDNPEFYEALFTKWIAAGDNEDKNRFIEDELRKRRKELIEIYVL